MLTNILKLFSLVLASPRLYKKNLRVSSNQPIIITQQCFPKLTIDDYITITVTDTITSSVATSIDYTSIENITQYITSTATLDETEYITLVTCTESTTRTNYVTKIITETERPSSTYSVVTTVTSTVVARNTVTETNLSTLTVTVNDCCTTQPCDNVACLYQTSLDQSIAQQNVVIEINKQLVYNNNRASEIMNNQVQAMNALRNDFIPERSNLRLAVEYWACQTSSTPLEEYDIAVNMSECEESSLVNLQNKASVAYSKLITAMTNYSTGLQTFSELSANERNARLGFVELFPELTGPYNPNICYNPMSSIPGAQAQFDMVVAAHKAVVKQSKIVSRQQGIVAYEQRKYTEAAIAADAQQIALFPSWISVGRAVIDSMELVVNQ